MGNTLQDVISQVLLRYGKIINDRVVNKWRAYGEDTKELAVGDKVIQNAENPVLVNEISTVSIEVADGYNKDLTLYMNGKKIEFSNGKAIVKEDLVEPLKLGGYIK